jgi:hypothetical protein
VPEFTGFADTALTLVAFRPLRTMVVVKASTSCTLI